MTAPVAYFTLITRQQNGICYDLYNSRKKPSKCCDIWAFLHVYTIFYV